MKSGYGVHLVRVTDLRPATLRPFRGLSAEDPGGVAPQQETEAKAAYLGQLREKYRVVIEDNVNRLLAQQPVEAKAQYCVFATILRHAGISPQCYGY